MNNKFAENDMDLCAALTTEELFSQSTEKCWNRASSRYYIIGPEEKAKIIQGLRARGCDVSSVSWVGEIVTPCRGTKYPGYRSFI